MTLVCESPMKERRWRRGHLTKALESTCRSDRGTGALEETSREEVCAPSKLRVGVSGLCFKLSLIYFSQQFLPEAQSLEFNTLHILHQSIDP